jgi:hypothetical protein
MTHLHASLRYDRDAAIVARVVSDLLDGHRTASFTEARRFRASLQRDEYRLVHHRGSQGQSECALLVHADDYRTDLGPIQLSRVPIPRRGGWLNYAVGAETVRGKVLAVHMPSGVEGRKGFRDDNPGQVRAYRAQAAALARHLTENDVAEVWGDWNLNARLDWVRAWFARQFPGYRIVAPATATYARRVIDFGLVRDGDWSATTRPNLASDHRAVAATHTPKEAPVAHLPQNLPALLRARGLKVVEVSGWYGRGRPGAFSPVGVLCHHTATGRSTSDAAVVNLLVRGRSDLPGPLCQIGLARDGTVYVIASGRANHAGTAKASGTVAAGDGNSLYIGIEAFNDGVGEPWPKRQYDAYVLLAATLCQHITGNSAATVRGHKETSTTGKVDPTFDMGAFRARVREALANKRRPIPQPQPTEEFEDMTPDEITKIVQDAVRTTPLTVIGKKGEPLLKWPLERVLRHIEEQQDLQRQITLDLAAEVKALRAQITEKE